jgi:AcrR family transcriptional regulator
MPKTSLHASPRLHRKALVAQAAFDVFCRYGIDGATMVQVAEAADVGVASVYRYYETKFDLALACALWVWETRIHPRLPQHFDPTHDGATRVRVIFSLNVELLNEDPDVLRFLEYFDNFVVSQRIPAQRLMDYNQSLEKAKPLVLAAFEVGFADGSIRREIDAVRFYYVTARTLMSLAQKLILRGHVVPSDETIDAQAQVSSVIDMAMHYLKP